MTRVHSLIRRPFQDLRHLVTENSPFLKAKGKRGISPRCVPRNLVCVRGQAYLAAPQGAEAATEFQKIVDHPGLTIGDAFGVLAYLGLARAYALTGDTANARAAYQDFFALWKDADPDIPILQQAKAEYAKLQ